MYFVTLKASFFSPRGTEHIPFSCSSVHHHSTGWPCKKEIGKIAFSDLQQKLSEVFFAPDLFPRTFRSASSVTMLCIKLHKPPKSTGCGFTVSLASPIPVKPDTNYTGINLPSPLFVALTPGQIWHGCRRQSRGIQNQHQKLSFPLSKLFTRESLWIALKQVDFISVLVPKN